MCHQIFKYTIKHPDPYFSSFWSSFSHLGVPQAQKGWETPRVMIFFTDITEQVKNETEFKKNLTKEKHLNELKTNFMNMVSHELRTPLSVILSNTELLVQKLKKVQNDTVKKHTDMIITQIDGMINLLNEYLFISKV